MMITHDSVLTPEACDFIKQWNDAQPYIKAHTSGSTGKPKDILLDKNDMRASAKATISFFRLGPDSTLLLPLSPDYIAGKMQIVRAIEAGCRLIAETPSSHPFADYEGECSLIPIVPSQLEYLMSAPFISRAANIIIGGAPLSPSQEEAALKAELNAYATYGMTETCSHVALRRVGEKDYHALPGFSFSTDARGCLVIDSRTLSFGQLVTNDVVRLNGNDRFEWLGRYDNVINSGGVKIHPEEIERVLTPLLPIGATAYVTSTPSDRWGREAVIVTDCKEVDEALLQRLKTLLPPHNTPHGIVYLDKIPLTSSGKIIRQKL